MKWVMKWIYTGSMFFLAFAYTKLAFNDFSFERKINRAPAAAPALTCKEMLENFYPEQTKGFIEKRIEANKDFHSFFRAFSPVFYQQVSNPEFAGLYKSLEKFRGTIAGDLHIENFGFVIDDKGKVIFTLNDFDDSTEGLLYHDVLRHYVSGKIVDKNLSWKTYLEAYVKGLKGEAHESSFYVQKGMEDVAGVTEKTLAKHISEEAPFKFIKHKTPDRATTEVELKELIKSLKEKFPKIEIFDHYVRVKEDGGSAGLKRFQVLARVKPQDKIQWLDIKESTQSGYDKVFGNVNVEFSNRMSAFKERIYDNRLDKSIEAISLEGKAYSLRFVDQFASGLKLEDIPSDDYADIIADEAYVVGRMHRLSLQDQAGSYAETWEGINGGLIEESLIQLKYKLKDLYKGPEKIR